MTKKYPTSSTGFKDANEKARTALAEIYGVEPERVDVMPQPRRIRRDPTDPMAEEELHSVRMDFSVRIPGPGEEREMEERRKAEAEAAARQKAKDEERERQQAAAKKKEDERKAAEAEAEAKAKK